MQPNGLTTICRNISRHALASGSVPSPAAHPDAYAWRLMLAMLAVVFLFLSLAPLPAQDMVPIQRPIAFARLATPTALENVPAIVRQRMDSVVRVDTSDGRGSGTYLGGGFFITAAHVVRGHSQATLVDRAGGRYPAEVAAREESSDIALLYTQITVPLDPVPVATDDPRTGDIVYHAGYDFGERLYLWSAKILSWLQSSENSQYTDSFVSQGIGARKGSISGDSGGPSLNAAGEYIGDLFANTESEGTRTGGGTTIAVTCWRIKRFLLPWNARIYMQSQQCQPGGNCPPQYSQPQQYGGPRIQPDQFSAPPDAYAAPPPQYQPAPIPSLPPTQPQSIAGPPGERGPPGPPGAAGPAGPAGPAGSINTEAIIQSVLARMPPVQVDREQLRQLVAELVPTPAPTPIRIYNRVSGETLFTGTLNYDGSELAIPWDPGQSPSLGVAQLSDAVMEAIVDRLPAINLQPTYESGGRTKADGKPIVCKIGQTVSLPPVRLGVVNTAGEMSVSNGPLGGIVRFQLSGK